jgi:hypothetical protein
VVEEHRIRLRGGWEYDAIDPSAVSPCRLTLPTHWPTGGRRVRLTRRFGQPPREAGRRVFLRLERMPGIQALELDGHAPVEFAPGCSEYEIPLDATSGRHRLVLVVDTTGSSGLSGDAQDWGHVSLVIRPEGPTGSREEAAPSADPHFPHGVDLI